MRLLPSLCCAMLAVAGCAPGHGLQPLPPSAAGDYRLGPGDSVRLATYGEEQLTGEFRVNDRGAIAVPLLGTVRAAGLTTAELEARMAAALRRGDLMRDPKIAVEIIAYRPVFILGEVNKPGQYPYQPGMTVVTAVAVAGGFTYRAVEGYAAVLRNVDGAPLEGRARRQATVQPGDVITVLERRF